MKVPSDIKQGVLRAARRRALQLSTWLTLCISMLASSACSLVFDPERKTFKDYGDRCVENNECASGVCNYRRCSDDCTNNCEGNAECRSGLCQFLSPPPLDGPPRVAFLYLAEPGEYDIIRTHDDGRAYIGRKIAEIETHAEYPVSASTASTKIDELVDDGYNIIVGTNTDYLSAIQNGALRHPQVNFLLYSVYSGFEPAPNLGSYMGRMYQMMYMMGDLAGRVTKTNRVGIVAPRAIPETVRSVNAFAQGARRNERTDVEVVVRWINTWTNPSLEEAATRELVEDGGVDVVMGYTESTTPLTVAAEMTTADSRPVRVLGYGNPDACEVAVARCISSAYWNWGPMLTRLVTEMVDGAWTPAALWEQVQGDDEDSVIYFSSINNTIIPIAESIQIEQLVAELAADSIEGRMLPFEGPVRDTAGATKISSGRYPTDDDLLSMCWYVQGIYDIEDGDPPTLVPGEVPLSCR